MLTESVDLMPTVLEWVGQPIPDGVDGKSLTGFLSGKPAENWRDYVYLELDFGQPDRPTERQMVTGIELQDSGFSILREFRF